MKRPWLAIATGLVVLNVLGLYVLFLSLRTSPSVSGASPAGASSTCDARLSSALQQVHLLQRDVAHALRVARPLVGQMAAAQAEKPCPSVPVAAVSPAAPVATVGPSLPAVAGAVATAAASSTSAALPWLLIVIPTVPRTKKVEGIPYLQRTLQHLADQLPRPPGDPFFGRCVCAGSCATPADAS